MNQKIKQNRFGGSCSLSTTAHSEESRFVQVRTVPNAYGRNQ
jgi:hypothetical protein